MNQGTINADTAGGTITVNGPALTNQGTLLASNSGNLSLAGTFTLAGLGTFKSAGGTVNLTGTLDNTAQRWR